MGWGGGGMFSFFVYLVPGPPQVESWHYAQSDDNKLIKYPKSSI